MDTTGEVTLRIIQRIREGVPSGVEEFVRHYGPRLLVFVRYKLGSRLRDRVEAEDVLQDFFASLVENRDGFLDKVDSRGVHRTIFRMLENRIKDLYERYFKTQKRDGRREVREGAGDAEQRGFAWPAVAGATPSFSRRIEAEDEYRLLERVVEGLDEPHQRLFLLKFIEELTNQEIADELGVSVSTVKRETQGLIQTIQRVRQER